MVFFCTFDEACKSRTMSLSADCQARGVTDQSQWGGVQKSEPWIRFRCYQLLSYKRQFKGASAVVMTWNGTSLSGLVRWLLRCPIHCDERYLTLRVW